MATWPSSLVITRDGYGETPPDRAVRSNMDVGPQKVRRRSSSAVRQVSFKLFLTDDEIEDLDDFYSDNDVLVFDFTDPRTGDAKRARFTDAPNYDLNETMYNVMVKLEYLP
jgi:hypothetical protein